MSFKKADFKSRKWAISVFTLLVILFLSCLPGHTKDKKNNSSDRLPPAPDTGSPEEDFSAGGTRDNRQINRICGINRNEIAYLLGNQNREFTLSAHPTFWFYLPQIANQEAQLEFVVTELETGKKIYDRFIKSNHKSAIVGISIPQEKQYALSPKANYAWSLKINCAKTDKESEIALEGWLTRLPSQSKLQARLAATPEAEKHLVYLKHNLLYDAVTELAQRRIGKPNNVKLETAWNQLLIELGWSDLIQQQCIIEPPILHSRIFTKKKYSNLQVYEGK